MFGLPAVLDPVVIQVVLQPAPGQRDRIAGKQHSAGERNRRPRPEPSKQITHWNGYGEANKGRRGDYREIGFRFFMGERTEPRCQRVSRPAANIQNPEQAAPVPEDAL